jgi:uncharacterized protein (DUF1778 family)
MEPRANNRKDERIDVRLDREAKAMIARAAALRQQSVSEFILSVALERSHEVIERSNVLRLDEHEAERFLAALAKPPEPSAKLRDAAERYRKAIAEGELETV